jgi:sec-independent protein translocase protein TatC
VISQIGLGIPLYLLYEISIHLVRLAERRRAAREAEERAEFERQMADLARDDATS